MSEVLVRQFTKILAVVIVITMPACGSDTPGVAEPCDVWFAAPPRTKVITERVPPAAYYPVVAERNAEAQAFLADSGISQISPAEVTYFAGRRVELPDVTRPFLVRGLYRSRPEFTVDMLENALWVRSRDEPADNAPLRRQPLVLIMQEVPETIYVTTGQ